VEVTDEPDAAGAVDGVGAGMEGDPSAADGAGDGDGLPTDRAAVGTVGVWACRDRANLLALPIRLASRAVQTTAPRLYLAPCQRYTVFR